MSMFYELDKNIAAIGGLSLSVGLAIVGVLENMGLSGIGLKWPNDLLFSGRKLAGILIEVTGEQGGPTRVVVGVGLNTRLTGKEAETMDQPWSELKEIAGGRELSRNLLAARLLEGLIEEMKRFEREGFQPIVERWNHHDVYRGRPVRLILGTEFIVGLHRGVDDQGALLLEVDGSIKPFHGGEISLRNVTGTD